MELKTKIIECLENIGIEVDRQTEDDIDLREYINDSLIFISVIIELEKMLDIEIPDEMLLFENFASLNSFTIELQDYINLQKRMELTENITT